ncbi:hypothetical protein SULPSESMR1_03657 (plasmid) [Pseudosulfitobacter pseudonitzschiae]|uniref:YjiS-like domain-containing protein n=1 Tax=Pseudosulfitobacter pseudonitzschiae TaxID=1402135 RepID=A0A221K906_9RHOB|nr:DUF1127 domain-containing protein [Pseudosulfitobacter pseudonitzschiae]ASM75455.1 hypothetical protein SULPSESMR1_03657 [Pseudosulfitobacter pseudonitzschiae]
MELNLKHIWPTRSRGRGVAGRTRRLIARIRNRQRLRRDKRHVSQLCDHLLRDIGLDEYAVRRRESDQWPEL